MSQVAKLETKLQNKSGIYPPSHRVLVRPDVIEKQIRRSILEIPDWVQAKYEQGQASGTLVAVGPDAFNHVTERVWRVHDDHLKELVEERIKGYSEPFADVGDRIAFAKYSGLRVKGADGEKYLILNDEDITARISDDVEFTDLDTRKGVGVQG